MGSSLSFVPIDLSGKVCLITGGNAGIGFPTAKELVKMHCHVFLACRNESKALDAIKRIKEETNADHIEYIPLDLCSLQSVRECAQKFKARGLPLHLLINNAGMTAPSYQPTVDGYESTFAGNHLGHFLLTNLLLDVIVRSAPARIINVASSAHSMGNVNFEDLQLEKNYGSLSSYSNSKLMNILFTTELQRRLESKQVVVHSLHPGVIATEITKNMSGISGVLVRAFQRAASRTAEQGAMTTLYVATDPKVATVGGKYYADCKETTTSSKAADLEVAKKLWEISEKFVKLSGDDVGESSNANNSDIQL